MSFEAWASTELSRLGYQNSDELVAYLLNFDNKVLIEENLSAMLDAPDGDHKQFKEEFLKRYPGQKSDAGGKSNKNKENILTLEQHKDTKSQGSVVSGKKKTKFVSLYSDEGQNRDVILLPGRHKCDCQASKHKLVNNCLKCGRIVCEQEGSGPCAFCQTLVISKEEKDFISKGTKKSEALHNKLIHTKKIVNKASDDNKVVPKSLQRAIEHKNKLLEFDRTSEKRTKVYDDESDYFQSNSKWINPADREKLQRYEEDLKQKKYDRSNKKFTIDLLGRKVLNSKELNIYNPEDEVLKQILEETNPCQYYSSDSTDAFQLLNIERPLYIDTSEFENNNTKKCSILTSGLQRLQDRELKEMRDEGMCLSMHQPWASLLISGIKIHEGRTWYHSHRGRLWIASAAKIPTPADISNLEQSYRILLKNEKLKFAQHYPSSCLLGCVDVIDVLPQEEYRKKFPEGESDSPYVFVCENPQEMIIKFPVKGQHKIYKLDSKIHEAAKKSLKVV